MFCDNQTLSNSNSFTSFLEKKTDLTSKLQEFILRETNKLCDENDSEVINKFQKGEIDLDRLVDDWDHAFTQVIIHCSFP